METYVALLRGVNVGGKNRLPMRELVRLLRAAGAAEVVTLLQSGNAVFRAARGEDVQVAGATAAAIQREFGITTPVVVRSAAEFRAAAAGNPFLARGEDPDRLHVAFLADRPDPARVAELDPGRSPPDEFAVKGREVYLFLPNGVARTKLSNAWLDSRLSTVSTMRNWRTVQRVLDCLAG